MPANVDFTAPVNLPQGSRVASITLYTFDSAVGATSTASFSINDGKGNAGSVFSATSQAGAGYSQATGQPSSPYTVDNQQVSLFVGWRLNAPSATFHSLCGVRIAYFAP